MSKFVRMFKPQFAPMVRAGTKLQTVRPMPKRMPKVGDHQSNREWTGKPYRSPQRVLCESMITDVQTIQITETTLTTNGNRWSPAGVSLGMETFAEQDGFENWASLAAWFKTTHGLPFDGIVIHWEPLPKINP